MTEKKGRLSAEERKKQIMAAATELFAEKGFSGTRTREIASSAGISETLIFQHFASKEELYKAILLENVAHHPLQPEIEKYAALKDDHAVFYTIAAHMVKHNDPLMIRLYLFAALEGPQLVNLVPRRDEHDIKKILSDYILQRIEDDAYRPVNPDVAAQCFLQSVFMFCLKKGISIPESDNANATNDFINTLVDVFLNGLK